MSKPTPRTDTEAQLRGFGPLGILAIVVILAGNFLFTPLSAILVLAWVKASGTPWRDIGYERPEYWLRSIAVGIVFGVAFKLVMKAVVMPLLGADPVNHAYHYFAGNTAAMPGAIYSMIVIAGWGEETLFRGYLFERLGKLFGTSTMAKTAIVVLTALWFGLAHYSVQGISGAEQAAIVGVVYGLIFVRTGNIWMLMIAHATFDLTALAMIYWNLETAVSRLVFG